MAALLALYVYSARVEDVHDGDTVSLNVSIGFDTWHRGAFRLLGCNARELAQPGGKEARDHLATLLPQGTQVTIRSVKPDKYSGRYDAAIILADGRDLVTILGADGWVAPWDGSGPKPVPDWPRATP